jgi:hypothetical protein
MMLMNVYRLASVFYQPWRLEGAIFQPYLPGPPPRALQRQVILSFILTESRQTPGKSWGPYPAEFGSQIQISTPWVLSRWPTHSNICNVNSLFDRRVGKRLLLLILGAMTWKTFQRKKKTRYNKTLTLMYLWILPSRRFDWASQCTFNP